MVQFLFFKHPAPSAGYLKHVFNSPCLAASEWQLGNGCDVYCLNEPHTSGGVAALVKVFLIGNETRTAETFLKKRVCAVKNGGKVQLHPELPFSKTDIVVLLPFFIQQNTTLL